MPKTWQDNKSKFLNTHRNHGCFAVDVAGSQYFSRQSDRNFPESFDGRQGKAAAGYKNFGQQILVIGDQYWSEFDDMVQFGKRRTRSI